MASETVQELPVQPVPVKKEKTGEDWIRDISLGLVIVIVVVFNWGRLVLNPLAMLAYGAVWFVIFYAIGYVGLRAYRFLKKR